MSMYGSIHTHFESRYDTANDLVEMIYNFAKTGAKKVVATEHGVFSSYEDLRDIVKKMKSPKEIVKLKKGHPNIDLLPEDFEIIPGIEGYFGENRAHLILIAKDYEGYQSLCRIISESNYNLDSKNNPIITEENLQKNIAKGHVICTSACIAGPFGHLFGLDQSNLEEKIEKLSKEISTSGIRKALEIEVEQEQLKKLYKTTKPLVREKTDAERQFKKFHNHAGLDNIERREQEAERLLQEITDRTEEFEKNEEVLKKLRKARIPIRLKHLEEAQEKLEQLQQRQESGEMEFEAHRLYEFFIKTFGKDNFFFEIQNHDLEKEKTIYNELISFALQEGNTNFIASNDIHVGVTKDDPDYEKALLLRNVMQYTRHNTYRPTTADDKEYIIKSDEDLRAMLLKSITDHEGPLGKITAEEIVDSAIGNIQKTLEQCHVDFPQHENHYPKFCDDENAEFEKKVREGIQLKFPNGFPKERKEEYEKRLEYELGVIKRMGYAGYHLIVADYLEYGRLLGYLPTQEEIDNSPLSIKDLKQYIKDKGYAKIGYNIGPGRGSGAGSLCCYALGITDIDPLPYNLLFERFLNVERVSMPDIDSDFRTDVRARVVDYCKAKYGADCICQIMTKSYGALKGNLRLAARYLGSRSFEEGITKGTIDVDELLAKAKPEDNQPVEPETIESTEEDEFEEQEFVIPKYTTAQLNTALNVYMKPWYNIADKMSKNIDTLGDLPDESTMTRAEKQICGLAKGLDGVFTGYGQHAAGTIISSDRVADSLPLMWNTKKGNIETQCTMAQAEAKGFLKMDFLGLENLNIITEIMRHPSVGEPDNVLQDYVKRDEILKDSRIYRDIFWTGRTQGVFQFESPGMKKMLMEFKPETFEDLILLVAAYRPGPMQYLNEIIQQKQYDDQQAGKPWASKEKIGVIGKPKHSINIQNKALNDILSPTYGCIIYQEQVMQIFQNLAGYSLGGADLVRRAMSKKHLEDLVPERAAFIHGDPERGIEGCIKKQGISEEEANSLFDQMMEFAAYAFNKSHATAYAMVAMFTAYQKEYKTADFFRVSLDYAKNLDEIPAFVKEMPSFGIDFRGPSLSKSKNDFTVEDNGRAVRFGLHSVKGFGEQEYIYDSTIEKFMEMNPSISTKILKKYIMLGMFKGAWEEDLAEGHNQHRHAQLRWFDENAGLLEKANTQTTQIETIESNIENIKQEIFAAQKENREDDIKKWTQELTKQSKSLEKWKEKLAETKTIIERNRATDLTGNKTKPETVEEQLENRAWETELLSVPFDVETSMNKLKELTKDTHAYYGKTTFKALNQSMVDDNGKRCDRIRVPAIVLSCNGPKKTKKGGEYYEVMLMDRNRSIITRRFSAPINRLDGIFELTTEESKWFNCDPSTTWNIRIRTAGNMQKNAHQTFVGRNSTGQEKVEAILASQGKSVSTCYIHGRLVKRYQAPAEEMPATSKNITDDEDFER